MLSIKKYSKCFKYVVTVVLIHEEIKKVPVGKTMCISSFRYPDVITCPRFPFDKRATARVNGRNEQQKLNRL